MKNKYCFTTILLLSIALFAYLFTSIYVKNETKYLKEKHTVVTSFYPMYIAAANIAGDCAGIEVKCLSEPQTGCLHDFQMTPEDMKLLSKAEVFVVNGGGMESFLTDVVKQYPTLSIIETIDSGDALEGTPIHKKIHEQEEGYVHGFENSHIWMSVKHYREQIEIITDALCKTYAAYADTFRENAKKYDEKLVNLEAQQKEIMKIAEGKQVISFHDAFEYTAEDYGIEVVYTLNLDEERQVSAGEVAEVLSVIKDHDIQVILAEELYGRGLAEAVLKEADVEVCYLNTLVRGDYNLDSYIHDMQENINLLQKAFEVN